MCLSTWEHRQNFSQTSDSTRIQPCCPREREGRIKESEEKSNFLAGDRSLNKKLSSPASYWANLNYAREWAAKGRREASLWGWDNAHLTSSPDFHTQLQEHCSRLPGKAASSPAQDILSKTHQLGAGEGTAIQEWLQDLLRAFLYCLVTLQLFATEATDKIFALYKSRWPIFESGTYSKSYCCPLVISHGSSNQSFTLCLVMHIPPSLCQSRKKLTWSQDKLNVLCSLLKLSKALTINKCVPKTAWIYWVYITG